MTTESNIMTNMLENFFEENGDPSDDEILQMMCMIWRSRDKKMKKSNTEFVAKIIELCIEHRIEVGPIFNEMLDEIDDLPSFYEHELPPTMFEAYIAIDQHREKQYYRSEIKVKILFCIPLALCTRINSYEKDAQKNLETLLKPEYRWTPATNEFQEYCLINRWKNKFSEMLKIVLDKRPELLGDHTNLLMLAANYRIFNLVKLLIDHPSFSGDFDTVDGLRKTPLMWALSKDVKSRCEGAKRRDLNFKIVKYLANGDVKKKIGGVNALYYIRENDDVTSVLKTKIIKHLTSLCTFVKMLPDGGRLEYNLEQNFASFTHLKTDGLVEITGEVRFLEADNIVRIVRVLPQVITPGTLEVLDPKTGKMKLINQPAQLIEVLKEIVI